MHPAGETIVFDFGPVAGNGKHFNGIALLQTADAICLWKFRSLIFTVVV